MPSAPLVSAEPVAKHPSDDRLYYLDLTRCLAADETLASVDSVDITDADGAALSGLTVSGLAVNAAAFARETGGTVAIGMAALFRVSGGTAGIDYYVTVTVTTSDANTIARAGLFQVRAL